MLYKNNVMIFNSDSFKSSAAEIFVPVSGSIAVQDQFILSKHFPLINFVFLFEKKKKDCVCVSYNSVHALL